jgi:small subunit ribosomal protein S19e
MVSVKDVNAAKLIAAAKEELKKLEQIKPAEWATYAKSGSHRSRPPEQTDFWYVRAASLMRRIYIDGPVGTEKLKTFYGGRKRRGTKPARFRKASGSVIRKLLQQLEQTGLVEKPKNGKGRMLTNKGRKFMDNLAYKVHVKSLKPDKPSKAPKSSESS